MKFFSIFAAIALSIGRMQAPETSIASSAVNELGIELHCSLAKKHANLCLSPLSIQMALVMAYAGADGQTRQEMAKVLRYPPDDKALNDSFSALAASLDSMCGASVERAKQAERFGGKSEPIVMTIANRLFGKKGYSFRPSFLDLLKSVYHSPLAELDFEGNPEKARAHINGWVEDQTKKAHPGSHSEGRHFHNHAYRPGQRAVSEGSVEKRI
jgi:serpin B